MATAATRLQDRLISNTEESIVSGKDVAIDAPTGSGKSRIFAKIAENGFRNGEKVIILSHRRNLTDQAIGNIRKWADDSIPVSIGMKGQFDQSGAIVSTTVQTANLHIDSLGKYDRIIVDEGHHAKKDNTDYTNLIEALTKKNPEAKVIAASATFPDGMEGMHPRIAKADKHVITFEEAIEAKLIDLPVTITPKERLGNNKTIQGIVEEQKSLSKAGDPEGVGSAIRKTLPENWMETMAWHYAKEFSETQTIAFFDSVKEAEAFAKEVKEYGIEVKTVHSRNSENANEKAFDDFENRRIRGLVSVDMISEGYDVDARGLFIGKITTSQKEYRQIIGRGARSFGADKGEKTKLVDMGASTYLHGEISAQADINNIAKNIESTSRATIDLRPESEEARLVWKRIHGLDGYAAPIENGIIYAIPNDEGYIAMKSVRGKSGSKLELLEIDGQKKGRPTREAFCKWAEGAIRSSEKFIARAMSAKGGIEELIERDWIAHGRSIAQNISLMKQPMVMQQRGYAR